MRVNLTFVPPGGGEADYSLEFDMPVLPRAGDNISISRPNQTGTEDFIVRRVWWQLSHPSTGLYDDGDKPRPMGKADAVWVECEFAESGWSSEAHKKAVAMYEVRGKGKLRHEATGY